MPEIAEVRLISDNIRFFLQGNQIVNIEIMHPETIQNWLNKSVKGVLEFNSFLTAEKVIFQAIKTKGKFCWITACGSTTGKIWYAMIGFGMSGNIRPEPTDEFLKVYKSNDNIVTKDEYLKHCHLKFNYKGADGLIKAIYYHDFRRFGSWTFTDNVALLDAKLAKLGIDPLDTSVSLTDSDLISRFRVRNSQNICKALMGQELIAGVGSYIKAETLYTAKIHPLALIKDIPDDALLTLYKAIQTIAQDAYIAGGASLYTYTGMHGDKSEFKTTLKVYGRTKDDLGNAVERIPDSKSPDKRSIFWVPSVQTIGVAQPLQITPKKKIIIHRIQSP